MWILKVISDILDKIGIIKEKISDYIYIRRGFT